MGTKGYMGRILRVELGNHKVKEQELPESWAQAFLGGSRLGDLLAEGVRQAAQEIGGNASAFALHVKGLEPPAHDPRAKATEAIGYATSNRGACHLQAFTHDFEEGAFIPDLGSPQLEDRFALEGEAENEFRLL